MIFSAVKRGCVIHTFLFTKVKVPGSSTERISASGCTQKFLLFMGLGGQLAKKKKRNQRDGT
jgi:hypothetical protein